MGERWTYSARRSRAGNIVVDYHLLADDAPPGVPWWPSRVAAQAARKYASAHPGRPWPAALRPSGPEEPGT